MKRINLKTERLIIRNFSENDYDDLFEYLSDKDTYKYEPGEPISIKTAKKICIKRSKNNNFLAVELEKKVIGHIYLGQIKPENIKTWETGFIFNKKFHGKGYATEALNTVIEYGFNKMDLHKIIAHCNPKNIPSWKLLERVKMRREGKSRENIYFKLDKKGNPVWQDTYEYGIIKKDL